MTRLLAAVVLAACNGASEPTELICTDAYCQSSAQLKLGTFPITYFSDVAPYALIDLCLNEECHRVPLNKFPDNGNAISIDQGDVNPGPRISVDLQQLYSSDIQIFVSVAAEDVELFHDGDVYQVILRRFDEAVIAFGKWSVDYRINQPNGPRCGPTCRQAMTVTPL